MMTKTAFFALLRDKENRLNPTAHIAFFEEANGNKSVIVRQHRAPNFGLSMHRSDATAQAAFTKYNAWLNEWLVAQAEVAQAHAEAIEMDNAFMADRCRDVVFFGSLDAFGRRVVVEAAHGEALQINSQMHQNEFFKASAMMRGVWVNLNHAEALAMNDEMRLNREYANTMAGINYGPGANERRSAFGQCRRCGVHRDLNDWAENEDHCPVCDQQPTTNTENVIPMNKAKAKQNQTPDNLPRLQLVDVMRAFLRTVPTSSQEQIDAVGDLSQKELRNLIIKMTDRGARVTAHLTKSKSAGYGFLTFGYNGQLPPGTYHKIVVSNMKNARDVASQYGAVMWNF